MPPNAAIWYSDSARATTQRGVDSCTVTLKVDSASTQDAPQNISANIVSGSPRLSAATPTPAAKAMQEKRTRASLDIDSRRRVLPAAPPIAPSPKAPSSRP